MNDKFMRHTRLSLALSLTIASFLVATVARAASHHPDPLAVDKLSQTIAKLINLERDRQNLLKLAIDRAIASKQIDADKYEVAGGKTTLPPKPRPIIRGRIANPQPIQNPNIQKDDVRDPILAGKVAVPNPIKK